MMLFLNKRALALFKCEKGLGGITRATGARANRRWFNIAARVMPLALAVVSCFAMSQAAVASCKVTTQCDSCNVDAAWKNKAIAATPTPVGSLSCDVHIVNLNTGTLKKFFVYKENEPGVYVTHAFEQTVQSSVMLKFNTFISALNNFEASAQSVTISSGGNTPDSAYDLPGNSQNQTAVHDYIRNNHLVVDGLFQALGGFLSGVDATGTSFGKLLNITVKFPDGSEGLFNITVLGIGISKWTPVEGTFYDSDGNAIHFNPPDYYGQSGYTTGPDNADRLANLLSGWGYWVIRDTPYPVCSWSCPTETQCILECNIP